MFKKLLRVLAVVVGLALGAGLLYFMFLRARSPGFASLEAEQCRGAYQRAGTAADSAVVDAWHPIPSSGSAIPGRLSCKTMRDAGQLWPKYRNP